MTDNLISKRSATERLIIAKTLLESVLQDMPTAEKKGKWEIEVDCEYDIFDIAGERTWEVKAKCSECDFAMRFIEGHGMFNFCPNCGARMEESDGNSD